MAPLTSDLRRALENSVIKARDEAERAAAAAIAALAVERNDAFPAMTDEQRRLRNALRARAKQLGGGRREEGMPLLVEEVAYVQWHRMLFARFLAENDLLMHPAGVPTTLEECAELAPEEGEADAWQLAARYAGMMLPGIFRPTDPTAQLRLAPEGRTALERIIVDLPAPIFTADDALGWVYQFWQTRRKEAVNKSGRKIGGADIAPVTQLFTEHYMVQFLLENSLGAWWATRHPLSPLVKTFSYLRWVPLTPQPPLPGMGEGEQAARPGEGASPTPLPPGGGGVGGEGENRWDIPEPLRRRMVEVARDFRKQPTRSEALLWDALRGKQFDGYKFRRQQNIGPFIVDFFCPSARMIVEVDGPIHDTQRKRDRQRQELLEALGLRFVRAPAAEVERDLNGVLAAIRSALTPLPLSHPRARGRVRLPSPLVGEGEGERGHAPPPPARSPAGPRAPPR